MRLQPALDNREEELSFMLPVEPIPQPEKSIPCPAPKCPPTTGHSRDDSFEFSSIGSPPPEPDQEIIFCGRILTGQRMDPNHDAYSYDDINNYNHRQRKVVHIAPADFDHCLYSDPPLANTTPLRPLLMGRNAGRSKSFNHRHDSKTTPLSKPKLGQSKSFCYLSKQVGGGGGGSTKVSPKSEEERGGEVKKSVVGEGNTVSSGRGFGRSKSFRKSVSFSSCFPIVSGGRADF